jgi:hypothetical protein
MIQYGIYNGVYIAYMNNEYQTKIFKDIDSGAQFTLRALEEWSDAIVNQESLAENSYRFTNFYNYLFASLHRLFASLDKLDESTKIKPKATPFFSDLKFKEGKHNPFHKELIDFMRSEARTEISFRKNNIENWVKEEGGEISAPSLDEIWQRLSLQEGFTRGDDNAILYYCIEFDTEEYSVILPKEIGAQFRNAIKKGIVSHKHYFALEFLTKIRNDEYHNILRDKVLKTDEYYILGNEANLTYALFHIKGSASFKECVFYLDRKEPSSEIKLQKKLHLSKEGCFGSVNESFFMYNDKPSLKLIDSHMFVDKDSDIFFEECSFFSNLASTIQFHNDSTVNFIDCTFIIDGQKVEHVSFSSGRGTPILCDDVLIELKKKNWVSINAPKTEGVKDDLEDLYKLSVESFDFLCKVSQKTKEIWSNGKKEYLTQRVSLTK